MSGLFGALNINDTDRVFVSTLGQQVVYDAINQVLDQHNRDLAAAMSVFVERETEDYKLRYKLPGGGRLQRLTGNASEAGAVKATGSWDVAFPLEGFGAQIAAGRVDYAYMSVADLNRHLSTVTAQDINTVRFEMLKALLNATAATFVDPLWGSLTVQRLANGDSVVYPPVLGSETEATDTHYLESGYAAASISDTNNPLVTIRDEIEEHFGTATGGNNLVVFINNAQTAKIKALANFDEVPDRFVRSGANVDIPVNLPSVPGQVLGRCDGSWVVEWRWMPANYMLGIHLDAPKPLMVRVDPSDTGLARGLSLVAEDATYPLQRSHYEHRFGFGVGNRLNGVVMELGTGGSYTTPTAYA